MKVAAARLSNFAQPIGASGYKKTPPFPLSGSGGVSIVNQDSSADIHTAYPFLLDLDTLAIFDFLLDFPVDLKIIGFPEILNCFFVAFLVYAVAHSMVCAVSKQHRLFHCFIIYQEIAQLTLKAVSEKLTAFKG